jgi:hypothetical protein
MIQREGFCDLHRRELAGGLGGAGVIALIIGRLMSRRRILEHHQFKQFQQEVGEESQGGLGGPEEPFFFFNLTYWGPILIAFGLVIFFIPAKTGAVTTVAARVPQTPKPELKPQASPQPAGQKPQGAAQGKPQPATQTNLETIELKQTNQVSFPALKLQGITERGPNSSALINGKTYFLGDTIANARLISIFENSVIIEVEGQMRSVPLWK